jgi:hypothetical protein
MVYVLAAMAKRMVSNFSRHGYPSYQTLDDDAQAKPCVLGVPWVNPSTLRTIQRHGATRTGPKGESYEGIAPAERNVDADRGKRS